MFHKLLTLIVTAALFSTVSAQNSRIDALGGCNIIPDISRIFSQPAFVNDYADQLQMTAVGGSFGPAVGVKSLGGVFNLAATVNQSFSGSNTLRSGFVSDASNELNGITNNAFGSSFPVLPHVILGVNLDKVTFGVDLFYETMGFDQTTLSGTTENTTEASVRNFGTNVSANLNLGNFRISPLFGFSLPSATGENEGTGAEVEMEKGIRLVPGLELGLGVGDFNLTGGFFYTMENYQLEVNGTDQTEVNEAFMDGYVGFVTELRSELLFAAQYNLGIARDKNLSAVDDAFTQQSNISHSVRFGFEKPVSGVWIFDQVIPRLGFRYSNNDNGRVKNVNDAGDITLATNNSNSASEAQVTTGLGITKGIATIDLAVAIGSWAGVLTGPSVLSGALSLDFGKRSSSSARSNTESSPSPVYQPENTETQSDGSSSDFDF